MNSEFFGDRCDISRRINRKASYSEIIIKCETVNCVFISMFIELSLWPRDQEKKSLFVGVVCVNAQFKQSKIRIYTFHFVTQRVNINLFRLRSCSTIL